MQVDSKADESVWQEDSEAEAPTLQLTQAPTASASVATTLALLQSASATAAGSFGMHLLTRAAHAHQQCAGQNDSSVTEALSSMLRASAAEVTMTAAAVNKHPATIHPPHSTAAIQLHKPADLSSTAANLGGRSLQMGPGSTLHAPCLMHSTSPSLAHLSHYRMSPEPRWV